MTSPSPTPQSIAFDDCVVLEGISYETYRRLSDDIGDRPSPRLAFLKGVLRIMSPLPKHESLGGLLREIVRICARATKRKAADFGSVTLDKKDGTSGAQADVSFYIASTSRIRKKNDLNFAEDPPPDLVVEIDMTSFSTKKLETGGIYSRLEIPEVWRYVVRKGFKMLALKDGKYAEVERSVSFPELSAELVRQAVAVFDAEDQIEALEQFEKHFRKSLRTSARGRKRTETKP